jgi:hypothetical protein
VREKERERVREKERERRKTETVRPWALRTPHCPLPQAVPG